MRARIWWVTRVGSTRDALPPAKLGALASEIADGNPAWTRDWAEAGGDERAAADDLWIAHHRDALIWAIRG